MICSRLVDESHLVEKKNKYLVDTNILLYLYGDAALSTETEKIKMLSNKFNRALEVGCEVFVPAVVIGEFINRYHKLEFNHMKKVNLSVRDYKRDYRDKQCYLDNNKYIVEDVVKKIILDRCKVISDGLDRANLESIFSINENQEFNDNLIIDIANRNNLYLISADKDTKKIRIR